MMVCSSVPSAFTTKIPQSSYRIEEKTSLEPFGDQLGAKSLPPS
jgi:hypothetical protein